MQAQPLKVISIDDLGVHIVELPSGTFLIDGEVVQGYTGWSANNPTRQVSIKNIDDVRRVSTKSILEHYTDDDGNILDVEEYQITISSLLKNASLDSDGDIYGWNTLEDEFEYRKFEQRWKAVYKTETTYSDPCLIDRTYIRQDSGNPYIVAGFLTGRADVPLYSYSRTRAVADLLGKKFESLGMEFKQGVNYSQTEGKKVWGNSTHSGLEFVTAFGKYIIGKAQVAKTRGEFKGSFEYLENIYKQDKRWIEDLIQTQYNLHFRNEGASKVLLGDVRKGVLDCINWVGTMDVKVKSETSKQSTLNKLNTLLSLVDKEILEK